MRISDWSSDVCSSDLVCAKWRISMCLGILSGHDEDQIGTLDRIAAHGGRLHTVGDNDRVEARHLDRRAAELLCEEGEESLGHMAARATAGYVARAGINAFAVELQIGHAPVEEMGRQ